MLGILDSIEIESLLKTGIVGRIGCHAEGETYVVPISYSYEGDYIYCHTHEGKKVSMMRKNPKVCFQVDEMTTMSHWKSVIIQGEFEELKEKNHRRMAMASLLRRYLPLISSITTHLGAHWPFEPDDEDEINGVMFRILVKEKSGRYESASESPTMPG